MVISRSRLYEVETNQPRLEPDEIMDINPDSESKFGKSDEHYTFELKGNGNIEGRETIGSFSDIHAVSHLKNVAIVQLDGKSSFF
ncbi:hypothetical protein TNCV_4806191 [Trichonephila clavipes]|nr:hypothetical protein TNCV_4806191 [Trichonephila clavipes]